MKLGIVKNKQKTFYVCHSCKAKWTEELYLYCSNNFKNPVACRCRPNSFARFTKITEACH